MSLTNALPITPVQPWVKNPICLVPNSSERNQLRENEATQQLPLPHPNSFLENLTRCVLEVLAGSRDLEQLNRWVSDDVYRHLLKRVIISSRARQATGSTRAARPTFIIGRTLFSEPSEGVIEGVVIVRGKARTRAVALRLERLENRWRASAINVL